MDRITNSRNAYRLLSVRSQNVPQGHDTTRRVQERIRQESSFPRRRMVSRMIDLAPHVEKNGLSDGSYCLLVCVRVCLRLLTSDSNLYFIRTVHSCITHIAVLSFSLTWSNMKNIQISLHYNYLLTSTWTIKLVYFASFFLKYFSNIPLPYWT